LHPHVRRATVRWSFSLSVLMVEQKRMANVPDKIRRTQSSFRSLAFVDSPLLPLNISLFYTIFFSLAFGNSHRRTPLTLSYHWIYPKRYKTSEKK
jgi:hypothetical protein